MNGVKVRKKYGRVVRVGFLRARSNGGGGEERGVQVRPLEGVPGAILVRDLSLYPRWPSSMDDSARVWHGFPKQDAGGGGEGARRGFVGWGSC